MSVQQARKGITCTQGCSGAETSGTAFQHFHVLLQNKFEAVLKWLYFLMRSHSFFVSTTSLVILASKSSHPLLG